MATEIRASGARYEDRLLSRAERPATEDDVRLFGVAAGAAILSVRCLHFADGRPYPFEDRLINPDAAPRAHRLTSLI